MLPAIQDGGACEKCRSIMCVLGACLSNVPLHVIGCWLQTQTNDLDMYEHVDI